MTIEVRIPTILRPYTKDQKAVSAEGATLSAVITNLDSNYAGLGERLLENGALRRSLMSISMMKMFDFLGDLRRQLKMVTQSPSCLLSLVANFGSLRFP